VNGYDFRAYEMTPPLPEKIPAACRREFSGSCAYEHGALLNASVAIKMSRDRCIRKRRDA